jgi:hypothetical protein
MFDKFKWSLDTMNMILLTFFFSCEANVDDSRLRSSSGRHPLESLRACLGIRFFFWDNCIIDPYGWSKL